MHTHGTDTKLMKSALYFSIAIATCILVTKIYALLITDSVTILASAVDSALDIFSSIINLAAMIVSNMPPDNNHRFGKNKVEDLAVFAQSMFFFGLGVFTIFSAIKRCVIPEEVLRVDIGTYSMSICLILTGVLLVYQEYVIRRTKSKIVSADKLHYAADFLSNVVAIISLQLSQHWHFIDPTLSILIAMYIIYSSWQLFCGAFKNLVDHEFSAEEKARILLILAKYSKDIYGIHELKTRYAGTKPFIQFHLEMSGSISLLEAHEISENIALELEKVFEGAEIIIHQDPVGVENNVRYREVL